MVAIQFNVKIRKRKWREEGANETEQKKGVAVQ